VKSGGWRFRLAKVGVMSDAPRVVPHRNGGTTTEQARDARARALRFVLDCHAKKKAARPAPVPDGRDDVRKGQDAHTATENYTG
jgi:hypothetical protein